MAVYELNAEEWIEYQNLIDDNKKLESNNKNLRLEFQKLKNWAYSPEELDGYDVGDVLDHIKNTAKQALKDGI